MQITAKITALLQPSILGLARDSMVIANLITALLPQCFTAAITAAITALFQVLDSGVARLKEALQQSITAGFS